MEKLISDEVSLLAVNYLRKRLATENSSLTEKHRYCTLTYSTDIGKQATGRIRKNKGQFNVLLCA
jgi:hypothetical protein